MAKSGALGMGILVGGVDLSGDVGEINEIGGGPSALTVTGIDKSAPERIGGLIDGRLNYTAYFNDAASAAHPTLSALPTTDVHIANFLASTIGAECACIITKQLGYDGTRAADGMLTFSVAGPANGYGLEWCDLLTAGLRTDTAGTNGTALDGTAATTTSWAAYAQVTALTGTNVVLTVEDSADNVSFAAVTSGAFTSVTAAPGYQRIEGAAGATLRRYVRVASSGTFTSATFLVAVTRHPLGATA